MPAGSLSDQQIDALFAAAGLAVPAERRATVLAAARDLKACAVRLEAFTAQPLPAPTPSVAPAAR